MWILLYIIFITCSFIYLPEFLNGKQTFNDQFFIPKEVVFLVGSVCVIGSSFFYDIDKKRILRSKWLGFLLIYTVLSFGYIFYMPLMFNDGSGKVYWNFWNVRPTLNLLVAIFLIQTLVENTRNLKPWVLLGKVIAWSGFVISVYSILQFFGIDQVFTNVKYIYVNGVKEKNIHMTTFLGTRILTSNYISLCAPMALMFEGKRYKVILVVMGIALALAESTVAIVAFVAVISFYLLLTKKLKTLGVMACACIVLGIIASKVYPDFWLARGRMDLWGTALKDVLKKAPFTGLGLGSFPLQQYTVGKQKALSAHNEYIQIFYSFGFIGIVILVGYLYDLFKNFIVTYINSKTIIVTCYFLGIVSFLMNSIGLFPMRIAPLALLGILYIAGIEAQTNKWR